MSIERGNTKIHSDPKKNETDKNVIKRLTITGYVGTGLSLLALHLGKDISIDGPAAVTGVISAITAGGGTWGLVKHIRAVEKFSIEVGKEGNNKYKQGTALINEGEVMIDYGHQQAKSVGREKIFIKKVFK